MIRKYVLLMIIGFCSVNLSAQDDHTMSRQNAETITTSPQPIVSDNQSFDAGMVSAPLFHGKPITDAPTANNMDRSEADSLHLPAMNNNGQVMPIGIFPYYWGGWYGWDLHQGINVNLGASVFAQFGKGAQGGAGFAQNIAVMYAMPLSKRLSLAIGGYFNNMTWGRNNYQDAGISGVLGYRFNEHWEAYVYGQKSLTNKKIPLPLYDMNFLGDRIGAAVKYNFNPSFSIQVSVESDSKPANSFGYYPGMFRQWP